jgi:hypothetical protein
LSRSSPYGVDTSGGDEATYDDAVTPAFIDDPDGPDGDDD